MAGTNIGNITGAGFSPNPGGMAESIKKGMEKAAEAMDFSGLMADRRDGFDSFAELGSMGAKTDRSGKNSPKESFDIKKNAASSDQRVKPAPQKASKLKDPDKEVVKTVADTAGKIKETVKEALSVTDEELENALETLGMTVMDLLDPKQLLLAVMDLKGVTQPGELMTEPGVPDLMAAMNELSSGLADELGIKSSDITEFIPELDEIAESFAAAGAFDAGINVDNSVSDTDAAVQDSIEISGAAETDNIDIRNTVYDNTGASVNPLADTAAETAVTTDEVSDVRGEIKVEAESGIVSEESAHISEKPGEKQVNNDALKNVAADIKEYDTAEDGKGEAVKEAFADAGGKNADSFGGSRENETGNSDSFSGRTTESAPRVVTQQESSEHSTVIRHDAINPAAVDVIDQFSEAAGLQEQFSYIDAADLIDQFSTLTRNYSNGDTTLSMQLNPENLGRLTLDVTSDKAGAVSANIRVENEAVRDSLNAQLAEVKATLESAGIRVTSVEVTVESHGFEEAYENQRDTADMGQDMNGNSDGGGQEAEAGNGQRRNLNINNLDEIADNMTEEERLAASIMRDNGGSVDFTA